MIDQVDTSKVTLPASGEVTKRRIYHLRVVKTATGATIALGSKNDKIDAYAGAVYDDEQGWRGLWLTGTITVEFTDNPHEKLQSIPGGLNQTLDGSSNTVVVGPGAAGAPSGGVLSTQVPDTTVTGTLAGVGQSIAIAVAGHSSLAFGVGGASTLDATFVADASYDGGASYINSDTYFHNVSNGTGNMGLTASCSSAGGANDHFAIVIPPAATHIRVRVSVYNAGTTGANGAFLRATTTPDPQSVSAAMDGLTVGLFFPTAAGVRDSTGVMRTLRGDSTGRIQPATYTKDFTQVSPAAPATTIGAAFTCPDDTAPKRIQVQCRVQGATGGTLDIYLQTSLDGGTTWTDVAHLAQLAAAAALRSDAIVLDAGSGVPAAPLATLNTVDGTPTLAVNTQRNLVGTRWRFVFVAGAGTSAGASQSLKALFTT